jgi:hypothetical protein
MAGDRPLIWGFGEAEFCPSCQFVARRRAIACSNDLRARASLLLPVLVISVGLHDRHFLMPVMIEKTCCAKTGQSALPRLPPNRTCLVHAKTNAIDPGCVKTCLGEGCAELFSQLPSSERSCQYNRLPHRRNRDGSSPRKLGIRVFTQPGPIADVEVHSAAG